MDFGEFNIHIWSVVSIMGFICLLLIFLPLAKIRKNESKIKNNETT
tara:strand:+ start:197 stop:334 length:138 start_codon:yes stop_codon:yes gene_type:complete